jgi:hypothetical protein
MKSSTLLIAGAGLAAWYYFTHKENAMVSDSAEVNTATANLQAGNLAGFIANYNDAVTAEAAQMGAEMRPKIASIVDRGSDLLVKFTDGFTMPYSLAELREMISYAVTGAGR